MARIVFTVIFDNKTGTILQTHRALSGLSARLPDGRGKITFDLDDAEPQPETHLKKVDIDTLKIVDCPDLIRNSHNSNIISQIREMEAGRFVRATLDRDVNGDGGASLRALARDIGELRAKLISK